jgi:archaellum component FlaC
LVLYEFISFFFKVERQLNERIQNQEQTIEQLRNQLNEIEIPDEDQQSIIKELTTELNELKQELTQRKDRLKEITNTDDGK